MAPVLQQYVQLKDTVAKSPVFVARNHWNNLPVDTRNIMDHAQFKEVIRTMVKNENARLTAERMYYVSNNCHIFTYIFL